ncbi:hypothetical protein Skr01_16830 [Sphaerisporangium krabiense]|nr:hypothetical protein Skr01_16830 [Sphaerisporangium krabiense]
MGEITPAETDHYGHKNLNRYGGRFRPTAVEPLCGWGELAIQDAHPEGDVLLESEREPRLLWIFEVSDERAVGLDVHDDAVAILRT